MGEDYQFYASSIGSLFVPSWSIWRYFSSLWGCFSLVEYSRLLYSRRNIHLIEKIHAKCQLTAGWYGSGIGTTRNLSPHPFHWTMRRSNCSSYCLDLNLGMLKLLYSIEYESDYNLQSDCSWLPVMNISLNLYRISV